MLYQLKSKLNSQNNQTEYFNRFSVLLLVFGLFCFGYFYLGEKTSLRKVESSFLKYHNLLDRDLNGGLVKKGVKKLKEERLEQLKTVFKTTIKDVISKAKVRQEYFETDDYIQGIVDNLVYEVKIRINNK